MKIKLKNLIITEYASNDKRKYRFASEIANDPLICHFVSNSMDEWLMDSENTDKLLVGPAYIIEDNRKLVGFIRLASLNNGVLNLHYGVHPIYRKCHYGTKILTEVSPYLLKSNLNINEITLHIKEINTGSIRCALNANYKYNSEFNSRIDDCKIKVYSRKN